MGSSRAAAFALVGAIGARTHTGVITRVMCLNTSLPIIMLTCLGSYADGIAGGIADGIADGYAPSTSSTQRLQVKCCAAWRRYSLSARAAVPFECPVLGVLGVQALRRGRSQTSTRRFSSASMRTIMKC